MNIKGGPANSNDKAIKGQSLRLLLIWALFVHPWCGLFSQNNTITAEFVKTPLSGVLSGIGEKCGVRLAFDHDLTSGIAVTLRLKNADVVNALTLALQDTPLWYIIVNDVYVIKLREELSVEVVLSEPEISEIRIGGLVREAGTREHLPYAGIQVEGTYRGTSSNNDGFFTLITEYADTISLIVSYIGYHPEKRLIYPANEDEFLVIEMKGRPGLLEAVDIVAQPHREFIQISDISGRLAMNA